MPERIFAGVVMFMGAIFFAFMMSNIAELVHEMNASSTEVRAPASPPAGRPALAHS